MPKKKQPTRRQPQAIARKMWAYYIGPEAMTATSSKYGPFKNPVAVIDLSRYDEAVEAMAQAICCNSYRSGCKWASTPDNNKEYYRNEARAALAAIGIKKEEGK